MIINISFLPSTTKCIEICSWALLPAILARILQVSPSGQQEEDTAIEQRLSKTLLEFINHTHQYLQDIVLQAAAGNASILQDGGPKTFAIEFVAHLRQCVKSVMVSFMEKTQLRQALLSSRSRAEVMHIVVQVGDKVSEDMHGTDNDWVHIREAFMTMLDN